MGQWGQSPAGWTSGGYTSASVRIAALGVRWATSKSADRASSDRSRSRWTRHLVLRLAPLGVAFGDVAFLHWGYEPEVVRPLLLPGTEPDSLDGVAYVGLVAFRMRCYGEFIEFNVRTYSVDEEGRRGVVFLTMEADRLTLGAGRPGRGPAVPVGSDEPDPRRPCAGVPKRAALAGPGRRWHLDSAAGRAPDRRRALEHFLTARWRLHHRVLPVILTARLVHNRWPLHTAELIDLDDELVAATGVPAPAGPPASVLYSPGVRGRLGLPTTA